MRAGWNFKQSAYVLSLLAATAALPNGASAISVDVAKKCNALLAKAFPPRQPGNPAAGSAKGSGLDQRNYFNKCVANNGNMDNASNANNAPDKK
jgi:hypothetical protein